jgi:acetyltransferase-like isoleucine patch superfamily enzyme
MRRPLAEPMGRVTLRGRVLHGFRRRQFHSFGERSIVHRPLWIMGAHRIAIGADALILHNAWLAVHRSAWHLPAPVLEIGDRVGIRPFCTISAAESVVIEDDVTIAAYSSVIDSDHTFADGRPNVMQNRLATAPIRIGRGTWIADRVAVLRGADIGECCIIGANSVVRGTIPPYSIAAGAPARVVGTVEGVDGQSMPAPSSVG